MFRNYLVFRRAAAAAAAAVVIFYCYYVYSLCVFFLRLCVRCLLFFFTLFLACKHRHTCQMYIGSCCEAAAKFDGEEKTHEKCTPWRVKIERNNAIEHHKEKIKKLNKNWMVTRRISSWLLPRCCSWCGCYAYKLMKMWTSFVVLGSCVLCARAHLAFFFTLVHQPLSLCSF